MPQLALLATTKPVIIPAVLQLFREATVTTMVRTPTLVTTVTGGVLLSTKQHLPGAGSSTTIAPVSTGTAAIKEMVSLYVVLGICDLFGYLIIYREAGDFLRKARADTDLFELC
jgi:hypothetical protein